jgi:phage FluMu protein Com/flagellar basal body-associated protein FliL
MSCGSCGKQLRAKDESAGKKIKCPGCGNVLAVPQSEEMTEEMGMDETAAPPAPPEKISVSCTCGKKLQVKGELAGKAVKCPGCQKVVKVPATSSGASSAPAAKKTPAKKPAPPPADDDNDFSFTKSPTKAGKKPARMPDEEEDDFSFTASKPKAKKSNRPLDDKDDNGDDDDNDFRVPVRSMKKKSSNRAMLLLVILVLVIGAGVGAYFAIPMFFGDKPNNNNVAQNPAPKGNTPNPSNPTPTPTPPPVPAKSDTPDFDLMPRDALAVVTVRVGPYLASEPGKNLKMWVEEKLKAGMIDTKKEAGVDLEDIERVSIVLKNPMDKSYLGAVLAKKPIADAVIATEKVKKFAAMKVGEHTVYKDEGEGAALFPAAPQLIVFGDINTVLMAAEKKLADKGPLDEVLKKVQSSSTVVTLAVGPTKSLDVPMIPPDIMNEIKPITKLILTLDETPEEIALGATVNFEMAEQAKMFKDKLQLAYLEVAKGAVGAAKSKIPPELGPLFETIEKGVSETKIADDGTKVTVRMAFPGLSVTSLLDTAYGFWLSAPKNPAAPENKIELKNEKPTIPEDKGAEPKKSDDPPALPKPPLEKKPDGLPPLPVIPPEKKPELPPILPPAPVEKKGAEDVKPALTPTPILSPEKKEE